MTKTPGRHGSHHGDARGTKLSSRRWLDRQRRDPFVAAARRAGLRSRAAYKLVQLDDRFRLLGAGRRVVDLGAAPGGWSQVAASRVGSRGRVVAVDVRPVAPIAGVTVIVQDIAAEGAEAAILAALGGKADVVLSDMAPPATGHPDTDHLRAMALGDAAREIAFKVLRRGGGFVAKLLAGGAERDFVAGLRQAFGQVHHVKPLASRRDSREFYIVALGFRWAADRGAGA